MSSTRFYLLINNIEIWLLKVLKKPLQITVSHFGDHSFIYQCVCSHKTIAHVHIKYVACMSLKNIPIIHEKCLSTPLVHINMTAKEK